MATSKVVSFLHAEDCWDNRTILINILKKNRKKYCLVVLSVFLHFSLGMMNPVNKDLFGKA